MSAYADHPTLPRLCPPLPLSPTASQAASPSASVEPLNRLHSQQALKPLHASLPQHLHRRTSSSKAGMDPLDLLSRVALGQYPVAPPASRLQPQPWSHAQPVTLHDSLLPKRAPLEPSPSITVHESRLRRMEYAPPPPSVFPRAPMPAQYAPLHYPQDDPYVPNFSPVSSDDGLTSVRTARPPSELPCRISKVMRTSKDSGVHKPRSQPSRFCHICSRTSKKVGLVACGNFATGACRKVVCQKCFNDHNWNWERAFEMGASWICTHCRQECPERAQCAIYRRTNERRREQQQHQKSLKVVNKPAYSHTAMQANADDGRTQSGDYRPLSNPEL